MSDLDERFRSLSRVRPPDLWPDIEHREPHPLREPSPRRQLVAVTVAFAVAAAGIGLAIRAFQPEDRPRPAATVENGKIAFVATGKGGSDIYVVNSDGTEKKLLVPGGSPSWSPDGTQLAFLTVAPQRLGGRDMAVIEVASGGIRILYTIQEQPGGTGPQAWSPDGKQLAFASYDGIYVMNVDGTGAHRITRYEGSHACYDLLPSWSPAGSAIVFSVLCEGGNEGLWAVEADGSDRRQLIAGDYEVDEYRSPVWSPDGTKIAFVKTDWTLDDPIKSAAIYVMNADGTGAMQLASRAAFDRSLTWSPDGRAIAFTRYYAGGSDIFLLDLETAEVTQLTHTGDAVDPAWQPVPAVEGSPSAWDAVSAEVTGRVRLDGVPGPVAAADRAVWVTTYDYEHEGAAVARIDATTNEIVATVPIEGLPPSNLAVGAGALWVPAGMEHGGPVLMRVDTDTNEVTGRVEGVTGPVVADATGVWAIQDGPDAHDAAVVRLDPETLTIEARIPVGNVPFDMVAGAGSIWIVAWDAQARYQEPSDLLRIDALSGELVATISINGDGNWIAADDAGVWISAWSTIDPNDWNAVFREVCAD